MLKAKTKIWIAAGAIALIVIAYFAYFRKPETQYNTLEVKKGEISETVSVSGTLKANDTIGLNFETTGRISDIEAKIGRTVAKGDVLAILNDNNLQLNAARAKADLDRARAESGQNNDSVNSAKVAVENAEKTLEETKDLSDANIEASDQTAEDAEKKLEDAQSYYDKVKEENGSDSSEAKYAKLTLDSAEAGYNDAKKSQNIVDQKADLDETAAQNNLDSAEARLAEEKSKYVSAANDAKVAAYKAAYQTALNDLDKAVLRAPTAGTIKEVNFEEGEIFSGVSGGDFAEMISFDYVLEVKVPESDVAKIKVGQEGSVFFDAFAADEKFEAVVVSIEPSATVVQDVVDYIVKMTMETKDVRLKDGMSADVDILIEKKSGIFSIPQRAVQEKDGKRIVQLLENGKPVDREVKLGLEGDGGAVEIVSGLKEGEQVITSTK